MKIHHYEIVSIIFIDAAHCPKDEQVKVVRTELRSEYLFADSTLVSGARTLRLLAPARPAPRTALCFLERLPGYIVRLA